MAFGEFYAIGMIIEHSDKVQHFKMIFPIYKV